MSRVLLCTHGHPPELVGGTEHHVAAAAADCARAGTT